MKPGSFFAAMAAALLGTLPVRAELFRPETVSGALLGGLAGAVIGHNDGRHGWEGAAYGVAAGALLGTLVGEARDDAQYRRTQVPVYRPDRGWSHGPRWGVGFGYSHGPVYPHHPGWGYSRHPRWGWRGGWHVHAHPRRHPAYDRPRYAYRGALLGGLAGAIIGHNDGRHGWEGAAYGLAGGYLLGSLADVQARRAAEQRLSSAWEPAPVAAAQPAQVTIINNYYSSSANSSMASANACFGR